MFADIACQVAYNYWDRIGDLIASFFPDKINPEQVYFSNTINKIPKQFQRSEHFLWLKEFQGNGYKQLNNKRRQVVHYTTLDTDFKFDHLKNVMDKNTIEKLQTEREELPDFYKQHISLTLDGYEKTLLFLEEVSSKLFFNVD
jgi:hypothetical protein